MCFVHFFCLLHDALLMSKRWNLKGVSIAAEWVGVCVYII